MYVPLLEHARAGMREWYRRCLPARGGLSQVRRLRRELLLQVYGSLSRCLVLPGGEEEEVEQIVGVNWGQGERW